MKKLIMLSAVAALVLGGSAYASGPDDPSVQIKAPVAGYKLAPSEFNDFAYSYSLSNGDRIKFTQSGLQRFWASVKNGERFELYAIQPGVFTTAAGARIEFKDDGETVVIDNYEKLPMPVAMTGVHVRMIASR